MGALLARRSITWGPEAMAWGPVIAYLLVRARYAPSAQTSALSFLTFAVRGAVLILAALRLRADKKVRDATPAMGDDSLVIGGGIGWWKMGETLAVD